MKRFILRHSWKVLDRYIFRYMIYCKVRLDTEHNVLRTRGNPTMWVKSLYTACILGMFFQLETQKELLTKPFRKFYESEYVQTSD